MSKLQRQQSLMNLLHRTTNRTGKIQFFSYAIWTRHFQNSKVSQEDKDSGVFSENGRKVPFWLAQVAGYQVLEMWAAGEL